MRSLGLAESTYLGERNCILAFDRYISSKTDIRIPLTNKFLDEWLSRRPNEKTITQSKRLNITKQLFQFSHKCDVCTEKIQLELRHTQSDYVPYIFSDEEIRRIFEANRKFTRAGISYVLDKYVKAARLEYDNMPEKITPHTFRHSIAMRLLQADVNIIYIKDILGHADVATTQIYVRANLKMKADALQKARIEVEDGPGIPAWATDKNLMQWLTQLGKQTR